ncbi:hypothetical protein TELCIR_15732, partial [Teladorsagia circumcincta]
MASYIRRLQARLADYSWRFAPAVYARLARGDRSAIPLTVDIPKEKVDSYLRNLLELLAKEFYDINFAKEIPLQRREHAREILENYLGFRLVKRQSTIEGAGNGVFVEKGSKFPASDNELNLVICSINLHLLGKVSSHAVVSMYPGTIYDSWDSILLQSLGNHFVLRCQDGVIIDGNDVRLSRRIHRSCSYRDLAPDISDLTWLEDEPFNYMNMGQYINNEPAPNLHNVQYFDLDIHNWPRR